MSRHLQAEWGMRVSLDLFFGGAGAGLLGCYLPLAARDEYRGLSMPVIVAGVALVLLGLLLLASELGRPANGLRSLVNRESSWMARGAIFNLALIAAALLLIVGQTAGLRLLVPWAAMLTVLCSGLVAAYPGFLLFSAKDIRLWRSRSLPWLMFFYSLMSGLSLLVLADSALSLGLRVSLRPATLTAMLPVTILFAVFWGKSWRRLERQFPAFVIGAVVLGIVLPIIFYACAAFAYDAQLTMVLGSASFLVGAFCLRYFVVKAARHEPLTFLAKHS